MASIEPYGEKLRHLRRALGLTQLELAVAAGLSERTVRSAERSRPIRRDFLDYLATALGVDIREIAREPATVASLVCWRRNLAVLNEALNHIWFEGDANLMLELAHPKMDVRTQFEATWNLGGMAEDLKGEFVGLSGVQRYVGLLQEFNSRVIDRKIVSHVPCGDENLLIMRGTDLLTYASGNRDFGWWVHVYEFDDSRILRCDEYVGGLPADNLGR